MQRIAAYAVFIVKRYKLAFAAGMEKPLKLALAEKRRYTISIPGHVALAVETCSRTVNATPTEYAADVLRWWFGKGCPPLSDEEELVRDARSDTGLDLKTKKKPKVSES